MRSHGMAGPALRIPSWFKSSSSDRRPSLFASSPKYEVRTISKMGESAFTFLWQDMQMFAPGTLACEDLSTP